MSQSKKQTAKPPKGAPQGGVPNPTISVLLGDHAERKPLIEAIEARRNSRVLAYLTIGRRDFGAQMHVDALSYFHEHLEKIGYQERLDLFLHTQDGFTLASPRIAYLLREYCDHLGVLVPRYAHSAGTTLALAADEVVMHRMGELGPIDPSVSNPFNPPNPGKPDENKVPISVEDVNAFLELAANRGTAPESDAGAGLERLASGIHPLALGNVYRQSLLIRSMGRRLLELHMDPDSEAERIDHILDVLTEKLYYHEYPISRTEAIDHVRLKALAADEDLEADVWALFSAYRDDLKPGERVVPITPGALSKTTDLQVDSAVIESTHGTHTFRQEGSAKPNSKTKPPSTDITLSEGEWAPRV